MELPVGRPNPWALVIETDSEEFKAGDYILIPSMSGRKVEVNDHVLIVFYTEEIPAYIKANEFHKVKF